MYKYQKGFAPIVIVLILLVLAGAGGASYYLINKQAPKQIACTAEAKLCPDGSSVGRTGLNCEFVACPEVKIDETANWQTYTNSEYNFELKYPKILNSYPVSVTFDKSIPVGGTNFSFGGMAPVAEGSIITQTSNPDTNNWPWFYNKAGISFLIFPGTMANVKDVLGLPTQKIKLNEEISGDKIIDSYGNVTIYVQSSRNIFEITYSTEFGVDGQKDKRSATIEAILSTFKFTNEEANKNETADWKTYRSDKWGFETKYPSGWTITDYEKSWGGITLHSPTVRPEEVTIDVVVIPNITNEFFIDGCPQNSSYEKLIGKVKFNGVEYCKTEIKNVTDGVVPQKGIQTIEYYKITNGKYKYQIELHVMGGRQTINYYLPESDFKYEIDTIENMLSSFQALQ